MFSISQYITSDLCIVLKFSDMKNVGTPSILMRNKSFFVTFGFLPHHETQSKTSVFCSKEFGQRVSIAKKRLFSLFDTLCLHFPCTVSSLYVSVKYEMKLTYCDSQ